MTDLHQRTTGPSGTVENAPDVDVVVVGAGMAGLYMLYRLRSTGMTVRAFEAGTDVGGTWYWNRYPGARCDVETIDYQFTWDPDLVNEWTWSERYATQPEILRYIEYVADKHDLRRDVTFDTKVAGARWDDSSATWTIRTEGTAGTSEETIRCRWYVMATGCLSAPKNPDFEGADAFTGEVYVTGHWPHEPVDFTGKRVAVIGTGSSAIQSIPLIADEADELVVFQRTPNFSIPAHNGPTRPEKKARFDNRIEEYRHDARWSSAGVPRTLAEVGALEVDETTRRERYEQAWEEGTIFSLTGAYNDLFLNEAANDTAAEFVRQKIRSIVDDSITAETLCPKTYPIGTKRLCLDTRYYETFNCDHVSLIDLNTDRIKRITATGVDLQDGRGSTRSIGFDVIVYATGFDAMTGAVVRVDIDGRDGFSLRDKWAEGPQTYLGLMSHGFPNLFMITGPQSPSVLSNMIVSIEQHVEWITDALETLRRDGHNVIEPTELAERAWVAHTNDFADITLFPRANSWYMGANVPGKPRVVLPYVGGVDRYRQACEDAVEAGYLGFRRAVSCSDGKHEVVNDGVVRPLAPDVMVMLDMMAELGVPPIETMSPTAARGFMESSAAINPPGPEVAEIIDGTFSGADGDLAYRRYVPVGVTTTQKIPIILYFHGGGWVLGDATSDDPFCRDLANRTGTIVVSVDYRHAPEHRFPAAHDDAWAAVEWISSAAAELGGDASRLAVGGWSAGANLAGYVARRARDDGAPTIAAQLMITPVVDHSMDTDSYRDNAEGYVLTATLMSWFMDHYVDEPDRTDTRIALLRADDLSGLPPAVIVTAEFDPLRDEGAAYADALRDVGTPATHLRAGGQIHTSLMAVDALTTPAAIRNEAFRNIADLLR